MQSRHVKITLKCLDAFDKKYEISDIIELIHFFKSFSFVTVSKNDDEEEYVLEWNVGDKVSAIRRHAGKKSTKPLYYGHDYIMELIREHGYDGTAKLLDVSVPTVRNWMKKELNEGESMPKKKDRKYNRKKYNIDISTLIEEKKSHTYRELAEKYGCSPTYLRDLIYKCKGANND